MKKLRTGFKAITPFGLYAALGVFKQIATENSASARELGSLVNVKPNIFQGINKYLETLNVNSVNIVYDPPQRTLPLESKASDVFHLAGTSVFHSSEQINAFVDKSTKGLVKKLEVEDPRNLYFFNVLTLKFNWERPFQREQSPKRFMNQNGIRFITVDDLKTKYLQQNEYTAVQLYFGKESINKGEADRVPGVHSYMIQVKNGARLTSDILSRVHTQLLNAEEGSVTFTMPSYKLDEEIKFDKTQFPALLADENKDFSSLGDVKKIKMKQKTTICVDENGASATGITTVETILRSFGLSEEIVFNTAFYHVIVEAESGAPLFIGHVTEANNNKC
ncbi:hypothetical protein HMI55_003308 [Coelomomyces lativittatus]|nr:hypothetical protein HMI55_003308 [Coelomomyces lativittatus]KAJ1515211.1 hypothetical protein HMI56_006294 [Coelomomyces lativittatus]